MATVEDVQKQIDARLAQLRADHRELEQERRELIGNKVASDPEWDANAVSANETSLAHCAGQIRALNWVSTELARVDFDLDTFYKEATHE